MQKSILIVDDQKNIRILLSHIFKKDYYVNTAHNGLDALNSVNSFKYDLIISDIAMPGLSGLEFLDHLLENPKTKQIPVLFLSAKASSNDRIEGLKHGAIDYICKPFNPEELRIKVQLLLHQHLEMKV